MERTAVARRYYRTPVATYVPEGARPEQSRILRVAAMLALATGISVTLLSGHYPDLSEVFGRQQTMEMDGQQALELMRIQAYAEQPQSHPSAW